MTTLIAVYTSDGCVGRCDAKCYMATFPDCKCICGGKNHGVGQKKALDNTRELAEHWLDEYAQQHNLSDWWVDVPANNPEQLSLPIKL